MYTYFMIETLAKIWMMFGSIVAVGLALAWLNDSLETLWKKYQQKPPRAVLESTIKPRYKITTYQIPSVQYTRANIEDTTDFNQKIVRIDFTQGYRSREQGEQLGEHVRVLPKAA